MEKKFKKRFVVDGYSIEIKELMKWLRECKKNNYTRVVLNWEDNYGGKDYFIDATEIVGVKRKIKNKL
jgi:hypothetical protein